MKQISIKLALFTFFTGLALAAGVHPQNIDIIGPPGSGFFGSQVLPLPNGNIVVIDHGYNNGAVADVGAIYLYDGASGALISTTTGAQANDMIGSGGALILSDGDFLVRSPSWDKGALPDASALTRCSRTAGCPSTITSANSLTGSNPLDGIGSVQVSVLASGNYVVVSPFWDNGFDQDVGAVTWCNKTTGCPTTITTSNSLIGSKTNDRVGYSGTVILGDGNYVVVSPMWNGTGAANSAGAVTFGNGTTGVTGVVSAANSLVGAKSGDRVGGGGVTALPNGSYVVSSPEWDNGGVVDVGAVTWVSGSTGITGPVSPANSLVGTTAGDGVGISGITALANGGYMVRSPFWDNGAINTAGAITMGNGSIGTRGPIDNTRSILGLTAEGGPSINFTFDPVNNQYIVGRRADNIVTLWRTAANASLAGRVTDPNGMPISNAIVIMVSPGGQRRTAQTGSLGYYLFENVPTGQTYSIVASAKRYRFGLAQDVFIDGNIPDLNFSAR